MLYLSTKKFFINSHIFFMLLFNGNFIHIFTFPQNKVLKGVLIILLQMILLLKVLKNNIQYFPIIKLLTYT